MEHLEKLKEWYKYYRSRHEKVVSMNIDEKSKFYPAFKEIEKGYFALYIVGCPLKVALQSCDIL